MKRHGTRKRPRRTKEEMRGEYRFDYEKAKPNRFVGRIKNGAVAVILDPDVAAVFRSSEKINALLRTVIAMLPGRRPAASTAPARS